MIDDRVIESKSGKWRFLRKILYASVIGICVYAVLARFHVDPVPWVLLFSGLATWVLIGYSYKCHKNHWKIMRYKGDNYWLWESDFRIMHNYREVDDVRGYS